MAATRALRVAAALATAAGIGCASQGLPPGGPPDTNPPQLVAVSPESGATNVHAPVVRFRFDEVVSERPAGAAALQQLVIISPNDGSPIVDWGRNEIIIRPRRGWRPNTAYTVTILPGLTDLRNNIAKRSFRTVFATGATIPSGVLRGAVFDWMGGKPAPNAHVEAFSPSDTTLKYSIAADSSGRYELGSLPAQAFTLRGWIDQNNNGTRDPREPFDTLTLALTDSARRDFYLFPHDTLGARLGEVTVLDSMTVRFRFDHGLRPDAPIALTQLRVMRQKDSSEIRVATVDVASRHDSLAAARKAAHDDSVAHADTTAAGRKALATADSLRRVRTQDSLSRAQQESIRASRDTAKKVPPPKMDRPVPPTEFIATLLTPLPEEERVVFSVRDVQALVGPSRSSDRVVTRRKPAPKDTTAAKRPPRDR